jgi:hypothetical protein
MSTNCGIALKTDEGYKAIYCHSDGYPKYMYSLLTTYYDSKALANKLVNMGDASSICKRLDPVAASHSFDNPEKDTSVFYCRDRGEDWLYVQPKVYTSKNDLLNRYYYAYIYEGNGWSCYTGGRKIERGY